MKILVEIHRETYGHDNRAINRHSTRTYRDPEGRLYMLSRTLDGIPPFYEAYGPYTADLIGVLPRLKVGEQDYWGTGWNWNHAFRALCGQISRQR